MNNEIGKLKELEGFLNSKIYGRKQLVKSVILSLMNSENTLIIGKQGEAKSFLLHLIAKHSNLQTFYKQIHNQTTLQDILGVINPIEFQKGNLELLKTKFWNSNLMFYDECLRNSDLLDFLLEVMCEHKCSKSILGEVDLKDLVCVVATSNPTTEDYHTEKLDLAMLDRFGYIINVNHLIEDNLEDFKKVMRDLNETNGNNQEVKIDFDIKGLFELKESIKKVEIPIDVYKLLDNFCLNCKDNNIDLSTRLGLKIKKAIQTLTLYNEKNKSGIEEFKEAIELIFLNRIGKDLYYKITDKLFNIEEYDLKEKIVIVKSQFEEFEKGNIEQDDLEEKVFGFLDYYDSDEVSGRYAFFNEDSKTKIDEVFKKINNNFKAEIHSKNFEDKVEYSKRLVKYKDLEELKDTIESLGFRVESKFLGKRELDEIEKLAKAKDLEYHTEKFEDKEKAIVSVKEFTTKQIKSFNTLTESLRKKEYLSRF